MGWGLHVHGACILLGDITRSTVARPKIAVLALLPGQVAGQFGQRHFVNTARELTTTSSGTQ